MPHEIAEYRILDVIGRGGMGIVYRAVHKAMGTEVALKTIYVRRESQRDCIGHEIRTLARIRHPGIVKILEQGISDGAPWYAMELLKGQTLKSFAATRIWPQTDSSERADDKSNLRVTKDTKALPTDMFPNGLDSTIDDAPFEINESEEAAQALLNLRGELHLKVPAGGGRLPELISIFNALSCSLSFLHGEGIVHRDLKPSNIFIQADLRPVLMDFGLVAKFWGDVSREEIDSPSITGGTLLYIAPEQILDNPIDARSDIYSFGCLMYELITGIPPFPLDSFENLLKAQLYLDPTPPNLLVDGLPLELNNLILNMLAKNPKNRIGHADDATGILSALGADQRLTDHFPKPKSYLYRPSIIGREKQLNRFEVFVRQVENGNGGIFLIKGDRGIGKTRFLVEASKLLKRRKADVVLNDCAVSEDRYNDLNLSSITLSPLIKILTHLAEYCRNQGPVVTERIFGNRIPVFTSFEPKIAEVLGVNEPIPLINLPPESSRIRFFSYMTETLRIFTIERHLIVIIDDLQFADELTLCYLTYIARSGLLSKMKMGILATYRSENCSDNLLRIINSPSSKLVELEKLNIAEIDSMVKEMLSIESCPDILAKFLESVSEGNPFFISEFLRSAVSEGLLYRDRHGQWTILDHFNKQAMLSDFEKLPLPRALHELLARRISSLSDEAQETLKVATILGAEIKMVLLWQIIPFSDITMDAVDELIQRQILSEPESGVLAFQGGVIRKIAYNLIPASILSNLHRKAAEAIESIHDEIEKSTCLDLAIHWEKAGEIKKSCCYYKEAARLAIRKSAMDEAGRLFEKYLEIAQDKTRETPDTRNEYVRNVLLVLGNFKEALRQSEIALQESKQLVHSEGEVESLLGKAENLRILGKLEQAWDCAKQANSLCSLLENKTLEAACIKSLGKTMMELGNLEEAEEYYRKALSIYRDEKDYLAEAVILAHIARVRSNQGYMNEALGLYEKAFKIYQDHGELQHQGTCLANIAVIHHEQGRYEKAARFYEDSVIIHQRIGDRRSEAVTLANIASLSPFLPSHIDAENQYLKSLDILREIGDRGFEAKIMRNYALLKHSQGKSSDAISLMNQSIAITREVIDKYSEIRALRYLASIYAETGQIEHAFELLDEALKIDKEIHRRVSEAITLHKIAELQRRAMNNLEQALNNIDVVQQIGAELKNQEIEIIALCEKGHILLAKGENCSQLLAEVQRIASRLHLSENNERTLAILKLDRALKGFESGEILVHGEQTCDYSVEFLKWINESKKRRSPHSNPDPDSFLSSDQ